MATHRNRRPFQPPRLLLQPAGEEQPVVQLTAAQAESFEASLSQASRGEFATEEQVRAVWAKHRL